MSQRGLFDPPDSDLEVTTPELINLVTDEHERHAEGLPRLSATDALAQARARIMSGKHVPITQDNESPEDRRAREAFFESVDRHAAADRHGVSTPPANDRYAQQVAAVRARVEQRNLAKAKAARDEAMDRAEKGSSLLWQDRALEVIRKLALRRERFTADDIDEALAGDYPREKRALGPVIMRAKSSGFIAATGDFVNSDRPSQHAQPKRIWRSLIFGKTEE